MTSKEALELAIEEYEKDLEYDVNNQWVKNVLKGLKECKQDLYNLLKENYKLKKIIDTWMDKIKIRFEEELGYVYTFAKFSYDEFEDIAKYLNEEIEVDVNEKED